MTIDVQQIVILAVGVVVSVIGWFIKRDLARFERQMEAHNESLNRHSESLASLSTQVTQLVEFQKWVPQLQRFFGDGGGHARLWRNIEGLQAGEQQTRDRFHWFINRLSVIKGSMEMQNLKCGGDPQSWIMPGWIEKKRDD